MSHTTLMVEGMTCEACRTAVQDALELPGVQHVDVSLETGIVGVSHAESVSVESLPARSGTPDTKSGRHDRNDRCGAYGRRGHR